jgi:hypothetical protein
LPCQNAATLAVKKFAAQFFPEAADYRASRSSPRITPIFQRLFFAIRRFPAAARDGYEPAPVVKNATGQAQKILYPTVAVLQ